MDIFILSTIFTSEFKLFVSLFFCVFLISTSISYCIKLTTLIMDTSDESKRGIVYVDCCGKNINYTGTSIYAFRDIILDRVNQLKSTIDFLKDEIKGKIF